MDEYLPIKVIMERDPSLNRLRITCIMKVPTEQLQEICVRILLTKILEFVQIGEVYQATFAAFGDKFYPIKLEKGCISVRTTLIFKNRRRLKEFLKTVKQM